MCRRCACQLLQQLLHIADLSNPSKPIQIYREWASRVMEEFFRQGDRERALGLDVSPMCDRNTVKVANAQVMQTTVIIHFVATLSSFISAIAFLIFKLTYTLRSE